MVSVSGGLEKDPISITLGLGLVIGLTTDIETALIGTLLKGAEEDRPLNALKISIIMALISEVSCLREEISDLSAT
ncbi:hypothetical protein Tco_1479070 [Tanacetum coccineum]